VTPLRRAAGSVSGRLPDFPWTKLDAARSQAASHPGGIVDLSVGTPVDSTPTTVQEALRLAADSPGYPLTAGSPLLRAAMVRWLRRSTGAEQVADEHVLPVVGSKELIASLALHLGLGPGDTVLVPRLAYPTYEVGARLAGCTVAYGDPVDGDLDEGAPAPALVWLNSPSNPTGRVLEVDHLRAVVAWARDRGALVVSDECYLHCAWEALPVSVLDPAVCEGSYEGVLAVHSLSKRSNAAGYRCAMIAGDSGVVAELLAVRKNLGLQMPGPQQHAMAAALDDDASATEQHAVYARRRATLRTALEAAGLRVERSEGSLYLWATRDEPGWDTVAWMAQRGVLVAPGDFYGDAGVRFVRVAFTATDERIEAAARRLT
jgi:succinyldiaminopimelate transaminase